MARKNLLKGLMETAADPAAQDQAPAPPAPAQPARVDAARPRYANGAIGAVSQSIAELKSRSVTDVDPALIDTAGLRDRLDGAGDDLEALVESIRGYGQQVPVLLRPNPEDPDRYQVVYGRRRVAALQQLGQPVKAMVRALDDKELVIAQGQENAARKDLSFIEKANFARQMRDAGYERKVICDALHMDKTLISRMLSVTDRIPVELIEAIGAAPAVGRDRWLKLADKVEKLPNADLVPEAVGSSSDARFDAVMAALAAPRPAAAAPEARQISPIAGGPAFATAVRKRGKTVFTVDHKASPGFDEWLMEHLAKFHSLWLTDPDK